jgi:hypothetical protein
MGAQPRMHLRSLRGDRWGTTTALVVMAVVLLAIPAAGTPATGPLRPAAGAPSVHSMGSRLGAACATAGSPAACDVGPSVGAPNWYNVTSSQRFAPPPLVGASLTYDPADGAVVLFGGCSPQACPTSAQTWEYTGGYWSNVTNLSPQPPARAYASFTFDSRDNVAVLFGGWAGPAALNDTWTFVGGDWTNITIPSAAPSARWGSSMAFDRSDNYLLLFGGCGPTDCALNDTWRLTGTTWKNISAGSVATPPGRYGAAFTYESGDSVAVLFGGCGAVCPMNDTWEFSAGKWTAMVLAAIPPARSFATLTYDTVQNATMLFGGNGTAGPRNDAWKWFKDRWTNETSSLGPGPAPRYGMAGLQTTIASVTSTVHKWPFDLFFGGAPTGCQPCSTTADNDTWVVEVPLSVAASVLPSVVELGQPASFTSAAAGGSAPYLYLWQFGDGLTSVVQNPLHPYLVRGMFEANVTASDVAGVSSHALVAITIVLGPTVSVAVSPSVTDLGRPVSFTGSAVGGTSPYTYRWAFGDQSTAATLVASHAYSSIGNFSVNLTVSDALLGFGVRYDNVTVHALPVLTTTISTSNPVVGENITWTATVTQGTGPYRYFWDFGDGATATSSTVTHAYALWGTQRASVVVTDAVGAGQTQNFTIPVVNATLIHPTPVRYLGLDSVTLGILALLAAAVVGVLTVVLVALRHRRRPPGAPLAAAAVGQPGWDGGEEAPGGSPATSRAMRRSFGRGYRRP